MSYWSTLKFNTVTPIIGYISRFHQQDFNFWDGHKGVVYRNNRMTSIAVHVAKRIAIQTTKTEIDKLIKRWTTDKKALCRREDAIVRAKANRQLLIDKQQAQIQDWGKLEFTDINHTVYASDAMGGTVPEALIIYYDDPEDKLTFKDYADGKPQQSKVSTTEAYLDRIQGNDGFLKEFTTNRWFHIDLSPEISWSSQKNLILTQVQGRDYTRKELVSGGDLEFTVNGNIVSNDRGVYPEDAVRRFVKIMQHNGILCVKSFQFNQVNVTNILVKSFQLNTPTFKNMQPYSFTCVAIEPDEDITSVTDTIAQVNTIMQESVYNEPINLVKILRDKAIELGMDATMYGLGYGLDKGGNALENWIERW